MTTDYEKMKNEVTALCSKLEVEKSRFKKMQIDLQKELQGAFEENTKLTTLLDGKVPKSTASSGLHFAYYCVLRKLHVCEIDLTHKLFLLRSH